MTKYNDTLRVAADNYGFIISAQGYLSRDQGAPRNEIRAEPVAQSRPAKPTAFRDRENYDRLNPSVNASMKRTDENTILFSGYK